MVVGLVSQHYFMTLAGLILCAYRLAVGRKEIDVWQWQLVWPPYWDCFLVGGTGCWDKKIKLKYNKIQLYSRFIWQKMMRCWTVMFFVILGVFLSRVIFSWTGVHYGIYFLEWIEQNLYVSLLCFECNGPMRLLMGLLSPCNPNYDSHCYWCFVTGTSYSLHTTCFSNCCNVFHVAVNINLSLPVVMVPFLEMKISSRGNESLLGTIFYFGSLKAFTKTNKKGGVLHLHVTLSEIVFWLAKMSHWCSLIVLSLETELHFTLK